LEPSCSCSCGFTPRRYGESEEAIMTEALIGLGVALALGVYLVITLIAPERF
jgi:hypothetical protein